MKSSQYAWKIIFSYIDSTSGYSSLFTLIFFSFYYDSPNTSRQLIVSNSDPKLYPNRLKCNIWQNIPHNILLEESYHTFCIKDSDCLFWATVWHIHSEICGRMMWVDWCLCRDISHRFSTTLTIGSFISVCKFLIFFFYYFPSFSRYVLKATPIFLHLDYFWNNSIYFYKNFEANIARYLDQNSYISDTPKVYKPLSYNIFQPILIPQPR